MQRLAARDAQLNHCGCMQTGRAAPVHLAWAGEAPQPNESLAPAEAGSAQPELSSLDLSSPDVSRGDNELASRHASASEPRRWGKASGMRLQSPEDLGAADHSDASAHMLHSDETAAQAMQAGLPNTLSPLQSFDSANASASSSDVSNMQPSGTGESEASSPSQGKPGSRC